jgi:hypothetical protein
MKEPVIFPAFSRKGPIALVMALLLASCDLHGARTQEPLGPRAEQSGGGVFTMVVELPQTSTQISVPVGRSANPSSAPVILEPDPYSPEDDSWFVAHFYAGTTEVAGPTGHEMRLTPGDSTFLSPVPEDLPFRAGFQRLRAGFTRMTVELIRSADGRALFGPMEIPVEVRLAAPRPQGP